MSNDHEKLTDDEFSQMINLLVKYSETELDQFDLWKVKSSFGDVFITISRSKPEQGSVYTDLSNVTKPESCD